MSIIAVDVMGGDHGPDVLMEGVRLFHESCPQNSFILYGHQDFFSAYFKRNPLLKKVCEIVHTEEVIPLHVKPSLLVRGFSQASMRLALQAVADKKADAVVSAGSTGAYLVLSKAILKTIKGIDRPAIACALPTLKGESIMLDLGGTLHVSWRNLVEYALMGDTFARCVLDITEPSIGLLNVGREESKGNVMLQQAYSVLKKAPIRFHGFIEGDDINRGTVSVIVTDGFTGNVALKTAEGVSAMIMSSLKKCFSHSVRGYLASFLARPFFRELAHHFDSRVYNGALWLGLTDVAVKSHGSADAFSFSYALEVAHDMVKAGISQAISQSLKQWDILDEPISLDSAKNAG